MAYRANVTDKEQGDIERFYDHSAMRIMWFDGMEASVGEVKAIKAVNQDNANTSSTDASRINGSPAVGGAIGSHNDKPAQFQSDTIGR